MFWDDYFSQINIDFLISIDFFSGWVENEFLLDAPTGIRTRVTTVLQQNLVRDFSGLFKRT